MPKPTYNRYAAFVSKQTSKNQLRTFPQPIDAKLDFSHNDYLNFSEHPALKQAAIDAANRFGVGNKASRILANQQQLAQDLERQIAFDKGTQSSLIFCSGFQANVSVLSSLLDKHVLNNKPLVFADRLNHASLHAGIQLAGAKQIRYRHLDYEHLNWLLDKYRSFDNPKFVITESIFGMDGDKVCLDTLIPICKKHEAFLYVDEAHATGLFGYNGFGVSADYANEIDLALGTFSKGLGCFGAYVALSDSVAQFLTNHCKGLIYTTMPPPTQIAVMQAAWSLVPHAQAKAQQLLNTAQHFRHLLKANNIGYGQSQTHIIPILIKDDSRLLEAFGNLKENGVLVSAIRPPSVMPNQSRLRIALNISHDLAACQQLLELLIRLKSQIDF